MKCKDCSSFRPEVSVEAGEEIAPNVKAMKGKCGVNNKSCSALDKCGCGAFSKE